MGKAKDKIEQVTGKLKKMIGRATNNRDLEAKGKAEQVSGNLKQAGEKIKDAFRH